MSEEITCSHCGAETTIDDETARLGGIIECPICGDDFEIQTETETVSLHDLADAQDDDPRKLARCALGMCLDNGHDILGADPEEHAATQGVHYCVHAVEQWADMVAEYHGETVSQGRQQDLIHEAEQVFPEVAEAEGIDARGVNSA